MCSASSHTLLRWGVGRHAACSAVTPRSAPIGLGPPCQFRRPRAGWRFQSRRSIGPDAMAMSSGEPARSVEPPDEYPVALVIVPEHEGVGPDVLEAALPVKGDGASVSFPDAEPERARAGRACRVRGGGHQSLRE